MARTIGRFWSLGVRALVFLYALIRCDVFIFSGFTSFFGFRELPLLRLLGKKVVVVFLGSDARPPIFSGRHLDDTGAHTDPAEAYEEAIRMVSKIRKIEKYADVVVSHTATAQFFSREFIRFMAVGMPINSHLDASNIKQDQGRSIRILHAPSRPLAKGSFVFRKIIEELKAEGYSIDFIKLVGVPNREVLLELQKCDFVIDELYSDIPLAMFATEAAIFGKPVVVGGYYAQQYKTDNPDAHVPPALYVEPEDIKQAIRKMIVDCDFRLDLGRRAHEFIQGKWNARTVAKNYLCLINGDIPEEWKVSPEKLDYFWGWGLSKENWRKQVAEYVAELGEDALLFDHNPKLKQRVLDEIAQTKVMHIP
ncbi:MAG: glycosyltransferase family 1 protein [Gallionellaceae bacterium]|nr:MAG: glycosyltransferase family 1 protein [Gallionellaceae bacterium]